MGPSYHRETMSPHDRTLKVLGLHGKEHIGPVEIYRVTLPFTYLNNHMMRCGWMPKDQAAELLREGDLHTVFDNNIVVLHRIISYAEDAGKDLIKALRSRGARVVYEVDDDYSGRHRVMDADMTWAPYLPYVDAVTVTTKGLAELVRAESGGKPVYIVPNAIDYDWFTKASAQTTRADPALTVMLAGTKSHYRDWIVLQEVIPNCLAKYPNVRFMTAGYLPDYLDGTGVQGIAPVPYPLYPGILAQADILCAPLAPDDPYNAGKSPIKAIEGWSAARLVGKRMGGCAVIASDCAAYRGVVQNRHNGLLVKHTPEAWQEALEWLIEDEIRRPKLQIEGLNDARQYDIATRWQNWHRAYTQIHGGAL